MTVTFFTPDFITYGIECSCGAVRSGEFATYEEAYNSHFLNSSPVCGDDYCAAYPATVEVSEEAPSVNMSNFNASDVLNVLGYGQEGDLCGSASAEEFLGRVLVAMALNMDAGVPAYQDGNVIHMGREEGYVDARLQELQALAEYAGAQSTDISWG